MRRSIVFVAALAGFAAADPAWADPASLDQLGGSRLALPTFVAAVPAVAASAAGADEYAYRSGTRLEAVRYRPRRHRSDDSWDRGYRPSGYAQIHGGIFDPEGDPSNGAEFGMRVGGSIDERVQLGVAVDWAHRSDRATAVLGTAPLPGGGYAERRIELARTSSDLVPLLGFVQVSPAGPRGPYFGIGGGYEALFISARDYETGEEYEATYDGWGWQGWGGIALPVSPGLRFNAELFVNGGDLDREVDDPESGLMYREIVNVDGGGARFGLSWAF